MSIKRVRYTELTANRIKLKMNIQIPENRQSKGSHQR